MCTHLSDQMWGATASSSERGLMGLPQLQAVVAMVEVLQVRLRRLQLEPTVAAVVMQLRRRGHQLQRGARRRLPAVVRRGKGRRRWQHLHQLHVAAAQCHVLLLVLVDLKSQHIKNLTLLIEQKNMIFFIKKLPSGTARCSGLPRCAPTD
jgi:hypothetical protein